MHEYFVVESLYLLYPVRVYKYNISVRTYILEFSSECSLVPCVCHLWSQSILLLFLAT
jgi:hypothetical protein